MKKLIPVILLTFVNTLNFSVMIPILPFIVDRLGGGPLMYGVLLSTYPFFQFFAAPFLGSLSDRYGRRPILLISQAGTAFSWVIFIASAFVPAWYFGPLSLPLVIIFIARIADGITGGNGSVANAYLTDCTSREEKTRAFGILGGVIGIGLTVGPAVGGLLMSTDLGYLAPIFLTFSISVITLVVMYTSLPESLPPHLRKTNVQFDLGTELQLLPKMQKYLSNRRIKYLFFLRTVFLFVFGSFSAIFVLFMIDTFSLSSREIGILFILVGGFIFFNQVVVAGFMSKKWGDMNTYLIGQIAIIISQLWYGFITSFTLFIPIMYLNNLGLSISMPSFKSLLSKSVSDADQGEIMGIDESMFAASSAASPLLATFLYTFLGAFTFALQAFILMCGLFIFWHRKGWQKERTRS